ncbi:putative aldo/keto reductase [Cryphonectria parasitica EP155]|uniref:Aldo/keto reductase n=1 Tax=Cryphonectria parasitica (strain ATCC 38755 / EP155) TaxID=660469 RepID=A0A9P4Y5F7_CRYP1|nr:putative aldo/keto reductase [Cryphonectria parasitica EP155]KAF3766692.1 putative aldo/keto reductase [Cryphonectria parasitica EP155]
MSTSKHPKIILGASQIGDRSKDDRVKYDTPEEINALLDVFYDNGGRHLDTARQYPLGAPTSSEKRLGAVGAGARFTIDTKVLHFFGEKGPFNTGPKIRESLDGSIADLNLPAGVKIGTLFLHLPDRETPLEATCEAIDQLYREGKFQRWGVSNFRVEDVEKMVAICSDKGFVLPSVYEGHYNVITRGAEKDLFPILRRHGLSYHAFGSSVSGIFAGNHKNARPGGRFDVSSKMGKLYNSMFARPKIMAAVDKAVAATAEHGVDAHAAALRWVVYHSHLDPEKGDAVIVGASSVALLSSNLDLINQGPLPEAVIRIMSDVFGQLGDEAPPYYGI